MTLLDFKSIKRIFLLFFAITSINIQISFAEKFLLITPQIPSHIFETVHIGEALLKNGHKVHLVLEKHFPNKFKKSFIKQGFIIEEFEKAIEIESLASESYQKFLSDQIFINKIDLLSQIPEISGRTQLDCELMMEDQKFLDKLQKEEIDMVIVEPFIVNMCPLILPAYLKKPLISLTTIYMPTMIKATALPSFYPRYFNNYDDNDKKLGFMARFINFIWYVVIHVRSPFFMNINTTLIKKFTPWERSYDDILLRSALFFTLTDHYLAGFYPYFPNMISLACLTCTPAKQLPENLNTIIEQFRNSKKNFEGLIILSFGSTANYIPQNITAKFLTSFSHFQNYLIFAKLSVPEELKAKIPKNVVILNWLPQNDLLGYVNTKLFITHCGNNGQHEALYHGIPMVGFPFFAEQEQNCKRAHFKNIGIAMNIHEFTESELINNMNNVLTVPIYKDTILNLSKAFKDKPENSQERGVYWIEHVLKHGSEHLRSPAHDMPLYQFYSFDVMLLLLFILSVLSFIFFKGLKWGFCSVKKILSGKPSLKNDYSTKTSENKKTKLKFK